MEANEAWADLGQWLEISPTGLKSLAVSRGSTLLLSNAHASFWLVMRGTAEVNSRQGHFGLARGEWLSLEAGSSPTIDASRRGLVLGLAVPEISSVQAPPLSSPLSTIMVGRGFASLRQLRLGIRRWKQSLNVSRCVAAGSSDESRCFKPLLHLIFDMQNELSSLIERSPGRSLRRRAQVFSRMQRARLHLEGHLDCTVRLAELAEISSFSVWYFTKTFHAIYGEGPQATIARLRMKRASRLLCESRLSVGEIAAACGLENICSFSRAFRSHFGVPPTIYRQRALTPSFDKSQAIVGKAS